MPAPKQNTNAAKGEKGIQVNFYLNAEEVAAIKKVLARQDRPTDQKAIRSFARKQSKNGIWQAVKDELPPIIL